MIEFQNVKKYHFSQLVLNDLSFVIENNDFAILTGRNGSGKTTTINLILGILKITKKDSGKIIDDFKEISYFPERFTLPSLIKARSFLYAYFRDVKTKDEIDYFVNRYNIPDKYICNLSKGMGQKIVIVKTLLEKSDLYIFDEPLNGLDDESQQKLVEDLKALNQNGAAVLISTHDPEAFMDVASKHIELEGGHDEKKH